MRGLRLNKVASQSERDRGSAIGLPGRARALQVAIVLSAALVVALVNAASTSVDLARRSRAGRAGRAPDLGADQLARAARGAAAAASPPTTSSFRAGRAGYAPAWSLALAAIFFGVHLADHDRAARPDLLACRRSGYDFGPWGIGIVYEGRKDAFDLSWPRWAVSGSGARAVAQRQAPEGLPAADSAEPAFIAESRRGRVVLRATDIDWIEAQGNYVALHAGGESYLIRQPLKAMDAKLRSAAFVRTHRRALVNTRRVRAIRRSEAGGLEVELANQEFAPLSDRHRAAVVRTLAAG